MTKEKSSTPEVLISIENAMEITRKRLLKGPDCPIFNHAWRQLSDMKKSIESNSVSSEDRDSINIGLMAVKENLENIDPDFADVLFDAAFKYRNLD